MCVNIRTQFHRLIVIKRSQIIRTDSMSLKNKSVPLPDVLLWDTWWINTLTLPHLSLSVSVSVSTKGSDDSIPAQPDPGYCSAGRKPGERTMTINLTGSHLNHQINHNNTEPNIEYKNLMVRRRQIRWSEVNRTRTDEKKKRGSSRRGGRECGWTD